MPNTQNLTYRLIEDNIHWLRLHNSSRNAVEDIFTQMTDITEKTHPGEVIRYLLDSGDVDELPFRYLMQRGQQWESQQGYVPPTRNAIIQSDKTVMTAMVDLMMRLFARRENKARIFTRDQHDVAIEWLKMDS